MINFRIITHTAYRFLLGALHTLIWLRHPSLLLTDLCLFTEEIIKYLLSPFQNKETQPVYGTLPFYSCKYLHRSLQIKKNDRFLDIGSGKGKLLLYFALIAKCNCIGIEKDPYFFRLSLMLKRIFLQKSIQIINNDFCEETLPESDIICIPTLSLNQKELDQLIMAIRTLTTQPKLISVGAPIPELNCEKNKHYLPCSWGFSWIYTS